MARLLQRLNMAGGIVGGGPVSDNFNRANNDSLGAAWSEIEPSAASQIRIATNRCHIDTAFIGSARYFGSPTVGISGAPFQFSRALLSANNLVLPDNQNSGLGVRIAADGGTQRGYGFIRRTVAGVAHRTLVRYSDLGGVVVLQDELGDFPILQQVMVTMGGILLQGWLFTAGEWVLRLSAEDATYATGRPGFVTPQAGTATYFMEWDDWTGGPTAGAVILGRRRSQYIATGAFMRTRIARRYA